MNDSDNIIKRVHVKPVGDSELETFTISEDKTRL